MKRYIKSSLTQEFIDATNQEPDLVKELYRQGYVNTENEWGLAPRNTIIDDINAAAMDSADPKLLKLIIDNFRAPMTALLIARNLNTPLDILQILANNNQPAVRAAVTKNPNADYSLVEYLSNDKSRLVESSAKARLAEFEN